MKIFNFKQYKTLESSGLSKYIKNNNVVSKVYKHLWISDDVDVIQSDINGDKLSKDLEMYNRFYLEKLYGDTIVAYNSDDDIIIIQLNINYQPEKYFDKDLSGYKGVSFNMKRTYKRNDRISKREEFDENFLENFIDNYTEKFVNFIINMYKNSKLWDNNDIKKSVSKLKDISFNLDDEVHDSLGEILHKGYDDIDFGNFDIHFSTSNIHATMYNGFLEFLGGSLEYLDDYGGIDKAFHDYLKDITLNFKDYLKDHNNQ